MEITKYWEQNFRRHRQLAVHLHNIVKLGFTESESAVLVVQEVEVFWGKARIPTSTLSYCRVKLNKLYLEWTNLRKGSYTHKSSQQSENEREFVEKFDDLFDVAHSNALNQLKGKEK